MIKMYLPKFDTIKRKRKCDLTRGNGGRHKPIIHEVGYKEHKRGKGYCIWLKGFMGWNPCGDGHPINEEEAIKIGKEIAKENKAKWIEKL